MQQILEHYCQQHRSKFFRNEKMNDGGQLDVWYSHKKADGTGFCVEKNTETYANNVTPQRVNNENSLVSRYDDSANGRLKNIFVCNAMNNAVTLATSGKIEISEIDKYFKKIYSELKSI